MARYIIVVDDNDRQDAPNRPWTANLFYSRGDVHGEMLNGEAGIGATPEEAVADLFSDPTLSDLA